ncbi:GNAT family N-acetyltransferase [Paenactinomyces guangxiensis]|uniref:GNAT family N-acetyltransferase n=1 Tax=Paenactinomyces guangxiensis TaxID=1490290 RepID=A0A7W1WSH2_9BACL|nr:GNAT family N-acetyltransferase [Paenactinomyces guangxiensis]MBA4495248.1 GNAT family N-acetyltransferase [Paenactinomyces guangxiensis]MBH8592332.1 GNAT family N-acetyltransferase [Paenactinomyces guangxiensis]
MNIRILSPRELDHVRSTIIRFMRKYGDGRITHHALRWFGQFNPDESTPGSFVAAALEGKKITGIIVFGNYGIDESFIAVHPGFRKQGVGEALLKHAIGHLDKVYTRVACDNVGSLKLCFSCGLVAFRLFKGPTGKPTLWLAGGNWNPKEVELTRKRKKPFA